MMGSRFVFLLLAYQYTITLLLAAPSHSSVFALEGRNASSPLTNLPPTTITSTVRSANGTDVSSSFHTRVYYQSNPRRDGFPASNLTGRQTADYGRLIDSCRSSTAEFLGSTCGHNHHGATVSLREYTIRCKMLPVPNYRLMMLGVDLTGMPANEPRFFREEDVCEDGEICVDSVPPSKKQRQVSSSSSSSNRWKPVARCLQVGYYYVEDPQGDERNRKGQKVQESGPEQSAQSGVMVIKTKRAGIVIAGKDGMKPVELDSLTVDVGTQNSSGLDEVQQQRTCRDCFGLRTQTASMDADFIKIEATLAALAATAGVVLVTIFAG